MERLAIIPFEISSRPTLVFCLLPNQFWHARRVLDTWSQDYRGEERFGFSALRDTCSQKSCLSKDCNRFANEQTWNAWRLEHFGAITFFVVNLTNAIGFAECYFWTDDLYWEILHLVIAIRTGPLMMVQHHQRK